MASVTGLAAGTYLALTPVQLKALRACKGDRARRDHVAKLACDRLDAGDGWWFLMWIAGRELQLGKSLHRGQMHRIELLDLDKAAAALAALATKDLRAAFFAIDEAKFRYRCVAFWVAEQWEREGRKTVLDDAVFATVKSAFERLVPFVDAAIPGKRALIFTTSY